MKRKRKKRSSPYSKIMLEDTYFKLGVEEVSGHIHAQNGIPYFYCDERGTASSLPFAISSDYLGAEVKAYMYHGTNRILLKLGEDDILLSDLQDEHLDLLSELEAVKALYEEEKVRRLPDLTYPFLVCFVSLIAISIACFFKTWFVIPIAILATVINIIDIVRITRVLRKELVYDAAGNVVNLSTGETSLSGGFQLPNEKEADLF